MIISEETSDGLAEPMNPAIPGTYAYILTDHTAYQQPVNVQMRYGYPYKK